MGATLRPCPIMDRSWLRTIYPSSFDGSEEAGIEADVVTA